MTSLVVLLSVSIMSAQGVRKPDFSDLELKMMEQHAGKVVQPRHVNPPTDVLAVPVSSFPYSTDFESGMPAEFDPQPGSDADVRISGTAASNGANGLLFEGNTSTNWGSTPSTYALAFDPSKSTHFGSCNIDVIPSGSAGVLSMMFDFGMGYSYAVNYSWFRVLVDGVVIYEEGGGYYFQPASHWNGSQWQELEFDLSAFEGAPFTITLQSSMKYYENYYQEGDIALIDDFMIWYKQDPGDVEGYVFNGDGLTIAGATVGLEGFAITTTRSQRLLFPAATSWR